MKNTLFIGLTIAVGLLVGVLAASHVEAQRVGPFALVAHSNQTANVGVFRLDTASGQVSFCYVNDQGGVNVRCTTATE